MSEALGVLLGVAVLAAGAWGSLGGLSSRQYARKRPEAQHEPDARPGAEPPSAPPADERD